MSKGANLFKNTLILGFGTICSQFIGFFLLPLYTRYLSPSEYGFADVATVLLSLLIPAITLETKMATFRFLVECREDRLRQEQIISNSLFLTAILALPWVIIFITVGQFTDIPYFFLIVGTGVAILLSQYFLQISRGLGNNMQFAWASIVIGAVTFLGALLFIVKLKLGIDGMLLSISVANLIASIYLFFKLKLYSYIRQSHWDQDICREMLGYSTPLVPNSLAWWMNNAASRVIVTAFIGTAANGIYAVATKFSGILNGLFGVFTMSWTESATLYINDPDRDEFFSRVANSAVRIFGAVGIILTSLMPFILPFMVTEEFLDAYEIIPIMILGVFFNVLVGVYSGIYVAKKLSQKVMRTTMLGAVLNIVLTFVFMPLLGLHGVALAGTITFLILAVIRHRDIKQFVTIKYDTKTLVFLAVIFIFVLVLYYFGNIWAHLINAIIAVVATLILNRVQINFLFATMRHLFKRSRG